MTLFFSLLPIYIFGNIHCFGMCGPLVMLLGQHRFRFFYFFGRLFSFTLAGFFAGELGAVLHLTLKKMYLSEIASLACGVILIVLGLKKIWAFDIKPKFIKNDGLHFLHHFTSMLMLKDKGWSTFLFGFFTILLPCGQTIVVFSACALSGDPMVGLGNGFAFALMTSPSLILAMHTLTFLKKIKNYDRVVIGCSCIAVGLLSCLRGVAEMGWMNHWILNSDNQTHFHFVIF